MNRAGERAYINLKLTSDWDEAFGDADFVIESVAENPEQKIEFYTELAKHLPEKTIVATHSSTMIPSMFAAATNNIALYTLDMAIGVAVGVAILVLTF